MVLPFMLGRSTLLRTTRTHLPQSFRRYKSLTQSIERGRQGGPDRERSSRPRARAPRDDDEVELGQTRRERRLEQFGGKTYGEDAPKKVREDRPFRDREDRPSRDREDRPFRSRDDRASTPRPSSRFGRVGRSDDAPSRFREERPSRGQDERPFRSREDRPSRDREDRPQRREERPQRPSDGMTSRGSRFDSDRPPRTDRYERRETSSYSAGDRPAPSGGFGGREERPRPARTFDDDRPKSSNEREKERRPWDTRSSQRRGTDGRKPFERNPQFETREGRPERPDRYQRPSREEGSTPYVHKHFDRKDPEDFKPREASDAPTPDAPRPSARDPESLPYTTAASEFIYGHSSVLAALKANRRKLYKLYIHSRGASRDNLLAKIRALKLFPITQEVGDEYLRAMDKSSSGRPHNGIVLETSPLPVSPITELRTPSMEDESFSVGLDTQSVEDKEVNGEKELYSYKSAGWRHPLILYVDGVLDEGNLGATARSAYFLGVDAIVTPTRQTAPWSHIALKASAGAAEAIPIFKVGEASDFLGKSSRAGWRIYASASVPPASSTSPEAEEDTTSSDIVYTIARSSKRLPADHSPVAEHPTILMMGAEGTGLRAGLLNLAHYNVGIRHGREVDEVGVDSLNVSVAASLLCYKMLQKPKTKTKVEVEAAEDDENTLF